ncbi:arabinosyltransferase domain-containing protein [Nocardia sp. NBC_01503]|uniref:arabinosyltransferase domain-containing protein n=1 Tax=Nocardia sp. NBC_01503 TaxID=2975997 RepID=UPI002E7ADE68|nr:arabinosyltransferase domain-containing protein [Nocardia sp. NBC_01503]WTL32500.1 arabinosyltransferase domain-containing protein [Nocardia sp. NBC_01503]
MTDVMEKAGQDSAGRTGPDTDRRRYGGWERLVALIAGLIAVLAAIAVPVLPVRIDAATIAWPQGDSAKSVEAPLISYAPLTFDASVPCAAAAQFDSRGGTLIATGPNGAPNRDRYGFAARVTATTTAADGTVTPGKFEAVLQDQSLVSVPLDQLPAGCVLAVHTEMTKATAVLTGSEVAPVTLEGDHRPQLVGFFTELPTPDGVTATAKADSRFSAHPSPIKRIAMWTAVLATLIALFALYRLDRLDGRRARRFLPQRWWTFSVVDAVVLGTLLLWHFIGSTTSDDGYQFGMGRTSIHAGYMANYFAYFGVPENPVGTPYYDLIGRLAEISVASPFVRLPALLAGFICWLVISREVIPRLGARIRRNRVAVWTGALGFLAVWLPYNNGLRPEAMVALGVLLTWVSVERAIATRRLLPYGIAILIGAFSCTVGPSGVICFAPLLAGIRPMWRVLDSRAAALSKPVPDGAKFLTVLRTRFVALLTLTTPLVAAGTVVLVAMFGVETLAAMFEMSRVHSIVGPNVKWPDEYLRYQYLLMVSIDGSVARRFGMFMLWLGMAACAFILLRKGGRIPGIASGPARRVLGSTVGVMLLMMTTPTKWTHHNGIYAGLAGVIAVIAAVALGPKVMRSPRNRALFAAVVAFMMALTFSSMNGWWYVSNWGISWNDKMPVIAGYGVNKLFLLAALLLLALAGWWHVRAPEPAAPHRVSRQAWRLAALSPLTVMAAFMVVFEVASFAKSTVAQYPSFSLARSNVDAVMGEPCGLARDVLVETDPNAGLLPPLTGDAFGTFTAEAKGFTPGGVATDMRADDEVDTSAITTTLNSKSSNSESGTTTTALPFGLDPAKVPVLGSNGTSESIATLTTGWYKLPTADARDGIVAVTAAGRIRSVDQYGVVTPGQSVEIEYGTADSAGQVEPQGRITPIDIGPTPTWRNLRVPFTDIPAAATAIRIVATDRDQDGKQWVALTPPRIPHTRVLQDLIGSQQPVLLDWAVGLQFPCQRPFDHRYGIVDGVPGYRILPDRGGAHDTNLWENHDSGGPLGWSTMLLRPHTLATYLNKDWRRDWGELQQFSRIDDTAIPVRPSITPETHSGLWTPGPINVNGWK